MDQLKMGYITAAQAETVGSNIKALINRSSKQLSVYKLDMNAGIVSLGRNHGAAQLPFGTFGSFTARMIKSKGMYAAKYRQILGSPA